MQCRSKEHVTKFKSKTEKIRKESAFIKHLESKHQGRAIGILFSEYFKIEVIKKYRKQFTKCVEGTYIANHQGKILIKKRVAPSQDNPYNHKGTAISRPGGYEV